MTILISLTGCGNDDNADLKQYISEVKAIPKGTIKPIPDIKEIEPYLFNPKGLRDPFKPLLQVEQSDDGNTSSPGNGFQPA